jgi:putative oxidoreductase
MLKKYMDPLLPYAPTILRIMAGITFLWYGVSKLGNPAGFIGFVGSLGFPIPVLFGWLVILLEIVGGLLLIVGLATRWMGLFLAVLMLFTTLLVKVNAGFIGSQGAGAELDLNLLAMSLALAILGPGALSVETNLLKREI